MKMYVWNKRIKMFTVYEKSNGRTKIIGTALFEGGPLCKKPKRKYVRRI